jgi:hypothetical protein
MKLIFYLFISSIFYGCETIGVGIFGVAKCPNGNWVNLKDFKRKLPALSDSTSWDFIINGDFSNRIRFSDSSKYSPESISGLKGELANNLVQIRRNITAENQKIKLDNDLKLSLIRTNPCQITNELIESILLLILSFITGSKSLLLFIICFSSLLILDAFKESCFSSGSNLCLSFKVFF